MAGAKTKKKDPFDLNKLLNDLVPSTIEATEDLTREIASSLADRFRFRAGNEYERNRSLVKLLGLE